MAEFKAFEQLFIEETDLNRLVLLLGSYGYKRMMIHKTSEFGILMSDGDNSLKIYESSSGKLGIRSGSAFDSDGNFLYAKEDIADIHTATSDSTTRGLYISYDQTNIEVGTVSLLSDGTVQGTDTEFTKIFKSGKSIEIINSSNGNDGIFEISDVVDDTELSTSEVFTAESGLNFKAVGAFTPDVTIPDENKRPFFYDSIAVTISEDLELESDTKFLLATFAYDGTTLTITDARNKIHRFKHINDIEYTTSDVFKVGGENGYEVLTKADSPQPIKNFRVTKISGWSNIYISDQLVSSIVHTFTETLNVAFKWGWDTLTGTGGTSGLMTVGSSVDFSSVDLSNYYAYISGEGVSYKINNNSNNNLFLIDDDGNYPDLTGINPDSDNYLWIYSKVDRYELRLTKYSSEGTLDSSTSDLYYITTGNPIVMSKTISLETASRYKAEIRGVYGDQYSNWVTLPDGTYSYLNQTGDYSGDNNLLVSHVDLVSTDASIAAATSNNGFVLTVTTGTNSYGWKNAEQFQVCWSTDNGGADFTNSNHEKTLISSSFLKVSTNTSAQYNIKVRPIIGGMVVGDSLSVDVISGSASQSVDYQKVAEVVVDHRTYSGTLSNYDYASKTITFSTTDLLYPASTGVALTDVPNDLEGRVITFNDMDCLIGQQVSSNIYTIEKLSTALPSTIEDYDFTIGVSKRARRLCKIKLKADMILYSSEIDCNIKVGQDVVLRVYQPAREAYYDSIIITDDMNDTQFTLDNTKTNILSSYGERFIIVDLYDASSSAYNYGCFNGSIVVYGKTVASGATYFDVE